MSHILVRLATSEDSHDVWCWRNDPLTRAMFKNTDEVSRESHDRWFDGSLANPTRLLFIGSLVNEDKIGICRFDIDDESKIAEVSLNLNPSMRGKNLSRALLSEAISVFRFSSRLPMRATIKKQNIASMKCFTTCGFTLDSEDKEYHYYIRNQ